MNQNQERIFEIFKILIATSQLESLEYYELCLNRAIEINNLFNSKFPDNFLVERKITNSGIV